MSPLENKKLYKDNKKRKKTFFTSIKQRTEGLIQ